MPEVRRVEERVPAVEEDYKALRVALACVDEMMAKRPSLTAGTEQAKAECDTSAVHIRKL